MREILKQAIKEFIKSRKSEYGAEIKEDGTCWICSTEMMAFCDMLDEIDDLIYLPCRVDSDGIYFNLEDIENSEFY